MCVCMCLCMCVCEHCHCHCHCQCQCQCQCHDLCFEFNTHELYVQSCVHARILFTTRVFRFFSHLHAFMQVSICACMCVYVCIYVCVCVCIYAYVYVYVCGVRTVRALEEFERSLIPLQPLYLLI